MSGSGNTGAGNKISDEEEALGWSEEASEVPSCCCYSLSTLASVTKSYLVTPENPFLFFFVILLYLSFLFPSFFQNWIVSQSFIPI